MTDKIGRKESRMQKVVKWCMAMMLVLGAWIWAGNMQCQASSDTFRVKVDSGYLALRTAKAFDSRNEIGKLYTGDTVEVEDYENGDYWYVYSAKLNKYGYVNNNYLYYAGEGAADCTDYTVSVATGYLALRTAKAYDYRNEIGELYTGDTVEVLDRSDSAYWYVYSPKLNKYGYVNKDYLIAPAGSCSGARYDVSVASGYLALRNAQAYDSRNEIGKLYNGDYVYVQDAGGNTGYWYVYSPKLKQYGYVNKDYLIASGNTGGTAYEVTGTTYYLALRNAKAYDASNEIGKLHNGEIVNVQDRSDSTYWYVYAPSLGKSGYVNKNYLK